MAEVAAVVFLAVFALFFLLVFFYNEFAVRAVGGIRMEIRHKNEGE